MSLINFDLLLKNANLVLCDQGSSQSFNCLTDGAIGISGGDIQWLGSTQQLCAQAYQAVKEIDVAGQWITPGLIDCHTHLVFGGNRAEEFEQRLSGVSYEEIAKRGGGIANTVNATRQASQQQLFIGAKKRLTSLIQQGVTSVEIKSGYGLDFENEKKMLLVAQQLGEQLPVTVSKTMLGAHALPVEYKGRGDDYIDLICQQMLPDLHALGLVDCVDGFCETIGFSAEQMERVFITAKALGLPVKLHAEQLSNQRGSELVAKYQGLSADHLEYLDEAGAKAMAEQGTVAVLLPGAFYFLRETQLPPIDLLRKHGVPIAIATDLNPGSSPICQLPLMLNMACTLFRMTPAQALNGVTINAAKALALDSTCGSLAVGKQADLAIWDIEHPAELAYQVGCNPLTSLFKRGQQIDLLQL